MTSKNLYPVGGKLKPFNRERMMAQLIELAEKYRGHEIWIDSDDCITIIESVSGYHYEPDTVTNVTVAKQYIDCIWRD